MKKRLIVIVAGLQAVVIAAAALADSGPLGIEAGRVCVTGHDVNPPEPFVGWGGFGWPGNMARLPSGELLLVHSAGYWHVSFAEPRLIEPATRERWLARDWPLERPAPTGGRSMMCRSSDGGKTWSSPRTVVDLPLDDGAYGLLRCQDGTLLCFINVQASWYGFEAAPAAFRDDIDGLNTQQCVVRSSDGGRTWDGPIWLSSPGKFYERSHAQPIQLPDGGILWPTYCADGRDLPLFGAIHRSDDSGRTWRTAATLRRASGENVDEPAIALLDDGRLVLVTRPDGALFFSSDAGVTWTESGALVESGRVKAPRLFVLSDGTVVCVCTYEGRLHGFLSTDHGVTWTPPLSIDPSAYGYPGGVLLEDDTLLVSYCSAGQAPNRVYVARLGVTAGRDGLVVLPVGGGGGLSRR